MILKIDFGIKDAEPTELSVLIILAVEIASFLIKSTLVMKCGCTEALT